MGYYYSYAIICCLLIHLQKSQFYCDVSGLPQTKVVFDQIRYTLIFLNEPVLEELKIKGMIYIQVREG
jgi:hypothetical protein